MTNNCYFAVMFSDPDALNQLYSYLQGRLSRINLKLESRLQESLQEAETAQSSQTQNAKLSALLDRSSDQQRSAP